ncbi:MAG TPA: hypothetical protein VKI19_01800, partial [Acidimicrobiales bacterium]|nr:hypothetical protein [Acidimicrobiales bacterium]
MSDRGSLADLTLGDIGRAIRRYQPFIATVVAIVLIVAVVPGRASHGTTGGSNVAIAPTGAGGVVGTTGGPGGTGGTHTLTGSGGPLGSTSSGSSSSGGSLVASGGGAGSVGGVASGPGGSGSTGTGGSAGTGGTVTPSATSDPYCDPKTGRDMLPTLYAPPCVPAWSGSNGGATYNGVTKDSITVAVPLSSNQAEAAAVAAAANDHDTQAQVKQTVQNYIDEFEHHVQTYGRKVNLVYFTSAYNSSDSTDAQDAECQSDATYVAKTLHAFMSWDQQAQECGTVAYQNTLAQDGVMCFCTVTVPSSFYLKWAP